ncbi:MAG: GNAT family N-acetyltransferase [Acidimicrobiia bacterium]|nr:GNAT family N-acetyltransferase [Acidimicrobiia bacterium]MDH5616434.1 GNAT family N-acetyltransferase [Acidimicrobiia bacterium]
MQIRYQSTIDDVAPEAIHGFFVGWADPPGPATVLRMFDASTHSRPALDGDRLVGHVRAISDGFYPAFLPELKVLPDYRGLSIGTTLPTKRLDDLAGFYSIDGACGEELVNRRLEFTRDNGMMIRTYQNQAG